MKSDAGQGDKVRNLDELQEADVEADARSSKLGALVVAALGGACLLLAGAALVKRPAKDASKDADPLGALVEQARVSAPSASGSARTGIQVTVPGVLSDSDSPTTALEAVRKGAKDTAAEVEDFKLPPGHPQSPPPAADRLPVAPLPAQHLLADAGKETETPSADTLQQVARHASRETGKEVEPGGPGLFQLQVSSFKTELEAQAFAAALRRREHHAYVEPANVKGRGMWYRVRIGPFKYKRSADLYRQEFEAKERLVTFVVAPQKTTVRVAQRDESGSDDE
jgi:cell division septation protein DedD